MLKLKHSSLNSASHISSERAVRYSCTIEAISTRDLSATLCVNATFDICKRTLTAVRGEAKVVKRDILYL